MLSPRCHRGNAKKPSSFMLYPARNHKEKQGFEAKNEGKTRWKNRKCRINPTPRPESYTLSFTRNYQYIKGLSRIGVGNVGFFLKTFFREEGEDRLRKCKTSDFFEANLRTFEAKHRNFTLKKSDVFGFRTGSTSVQAKLPLSLETPAYPQGHALSLQKRM